MKKLFLSSLIATLSLFAETKIFVSDTGAYSGAGKEVFFGTFADYSKERVKINNMIAKGTVGAANGALAQGANIMAKGAQGAVAGAGFSLLYGLMDPFVMSFYADQEFILIKQDQNGELKAVYLVGDKHPSLTKEEAYKLMKNR